MSLHPFYVCAFVSFALAGCNTFGDFEERYPFHAPGDDAGVSDEISLAGSWIAGTESPTVAEISVDSLEEPVGVWIAFVAPKPDFSVTEVGGLGANWTRLAAQCSASNASSLEVWIATDAASSSGEVTAGFQIAPASAVLGVLHYRGAVGATLVGKGNTQGPLGACPGDGVDTDTYSIEVPQEDRGKHLVGAVSLRNKRHSPGAGFDELLELALAELGGSSSGLAIVEHAAGELGPEVVTGTLNAATDWAAVVVALD